jgi:peptide/nickel transport system ATP-binding protein
MSNQLSLNNVSFGYSTQRLTIQNIDLSIAKGVNLGIIGESGSGKSTIVKLLLGILIPNSGEVRLHDELINPRDRMQKTHFQRDVQVVFQDPFSSLDPRQRIGKAVGEPLHSLKIDREQEFSSARARRLWVSDEVAKALDSVGLPENIMDRYPHEFSGGQRQRIAIARAIICKPKVLIADEPVSALDVTTRELILNLFQSLQKSHDLTIAVVSHDLSAVAALCELAIVLESGSIVERGSMATLLSEPQHPYTQKLLRSIPRLPSN